MNDEKTAPETVHRGRFPVARIPASPRFVGKSAEKLSQPVNRIEKDES